MYTKVYHPNLFTTGGYWEFYKGKTLAAIRDEEGLRLVHHVTFPPEITRAQGFRYWEKHFAERPYYALPEPLEEAINKEAIYRGHFIDKYGERVTIYG